MFIKAIQVAIAVLFFTCTGALAFFVGHNTFTIPVVLAVKDHSTTAPQGGQLYVIWEVKENWRSCQVHAHRYLTNTQTLSKYNIPLVTVENASNGSDRTVTVQLPKQIPPGYYQYRVDIEYSCNVAHRLFGPTHVSSPPFFVRILDNTQEPTYNKSQGK